MQESLRSSLYLLDQTHALGWAAWTYHWNVVGPTQYSDHLLYMRVYESLHGMIDGLAEKITGTFGPGSIVASRSLNGAARALSVSDDVSPRSLLDGIDAHLAAINDTRESLISDGLLSSGFDNYLQGMEDTQETNRYLLSQRSL